uniref:Uncharacterized protein n=1 Tax=Plectus sambesii TaxID=2011161 RepID=A0A914X5D8_9BILA
MRGQASLPLRPAQRGGRTRPAAHSIARRWALLEERGGNIQNNPVLRSKTGLIAARSIAPSQASPLMRGQASLSLRPAQRGGRTRAAAHLMARRRALLDRPAAVAPVAAWSYRRFRLFWWVDAVDRATLRAPPLLAGGLGGRVPPTIDFP